MAYCDAKVVVRDAAMIKKKILSSPKGVTCRDIERELLQYLVRVIEFSYLLESATFCYA